MENRRLVHPSTLVGDKGYLILVGRLGSWPITTWVGCSITHMQDSSSPQTLVLDYCLMNEWRLDGW